jgi:hypothetical protein
MKKLLWAIIIPILLLSFTACKKSVKVTVKTNTELLTQTSWKFDNAKVSGTDVSAFVSACQKDNLYTFVSNGTGTADEGATKCAAGDPQSTAFTWNFASNETVLHVSIALFAGGSQDLTIVSLSETQLVVSGNITVGGSTQNAVVTLKH